MIEEKEKKKRRRGHNQGSIFQRKDGRWCASVSLGYKDGKVQRKCFYAATQKEVSDLLDDARGNLKKGVAPTIGKKLTLGAYLEEWLASNINRRPGTMRVYSQHVKTHISPALGHIELTKLTPEDIERYMNRLESKSLARYHRMMLATVLRQAEKRGYVVRNVAKLVDRPEVKQREAVIFTREQIETFLLALKGERFETFFRVSLMTGLRKGEVIGLRWVDVDLDAGTISPRFQVTRKGDGVEFAELKTEKSKRVAGIDEGLIPYLREWRRQQLEQRMACATWVDNGLVFTNGRGGTIEPSILNRHLSRILKAAGLPNCHVHDLRHDYATYLREAGVDLKMQSELMGHANTQITLNLYTHVKSAERIIASTAVSRMFAAR